MHVLVKNVSESKIKRLLNKKKTTVSELGHRFICCAASGSTPVIILRFYKLHKNDPQLLLHLVNSCLSTYYDHNFKLERNLYTVGFNKLLLYITSELYSSTSYSLLTKYRI